LAAKIVILNGVGSAGKSTIAKELQQIAREPFLHLEMDSFLAMMPEAYQNHSDGLSFEVLEENGKPSVFAKTGIVAERVLSGMRRSVAALATSGNNLIVDDVLFGNVTTEYGNAVSEYRTLLTHFDLYLVGVFASLETLEKRERQRGDREIGLARWQYNRVHEKMSYDLEVHTDKITAAECAKQIKQRFQL